MNRKDDPLVVPAGAAQPKRRYRTPALLTFGNVAILTRSSVCSTMADSDTVVGCGPGNMAMSSERRLKENISRIGLHPLGFGLYLFQYKPEFRDQWGHGRQFGVMADEVESVMPAAVGRHPDGYRTVDYSMLGITRFVQ